MGLQRRAASSDWGELSAYQYMRVSEAFCEAMVESHGGGRTRRVARGERTFHEEALQAELERERLMHQVESSLEVTPVTERLFAFRWTLA